MMTAAKTIFPVTLLTQNGHVRLQRNEVTAGVSEVKLIIHRLANSNPDTSAYYHFYQYVV